MIEPTPSLREQTGADKIYVLERYGKTIILPTRESPNHYAETHPECHWLPQRHDYALSHLTMTDHFIPTLTSHLEARGMSANEISGVVDLLFEGQRYLGHSWHRRHVNKDRFDQGKVWVLGNGKKSSFYGSAYGGKIVSVVTDLDDLCLN